MRVQAVDDAADRAVVDHVAGEDALHMVELVQDLLEPELVGLVDDDEEHLVMGRLARAWRSPRCWQASSVPSSDSRGS